jgi:hypothetical protein
VVILIIFHKILQQCSLFVIQYHNNVVYLRLFVIQYYNNVVYLLFNITRSKRYTTVKHANLSLNIKLLYSIEYT